VYEGEERAKLKGKLLHSAPNLQLWGTRSESTSCLSPASRYAALILFNGDSKRTSFGWTADGRWFELGLYLALCPVAHRPVVVAHRLSGAGTSLVGPASYDILDQLARLSVDQLCLSLGVGNDFVGAGKPWRSFESQR
jgi:hypothetical protein